MKHIKLFEQFIAEATGNNKRIKEIQDELTDIYSQMEDIQDALDSGETDPDEAELQLSDLDGFKMELEGELAELQKGSNADELGAVQKLMDKFYELSTGAQSHKWAYMVNNVPEDQKRTMESLKKRDQQIEEADKAKAEMVAKKIEKASKGFSEETKSYISYFMNEYLGTYLEFSRKAMTLQGAKESCSDYKYGCEGVREYEAEYKKAESEYKEAKAELASKQAELLK